MVWDLALYWPWLATQNGSGAGFNVARTPAEQPSMSPALPTVTKQFWISREFGSQSFFSHTFGASVKIRVAVLSSVS